MGGFSSTPSAVNFSGVLFKDVDLSRIKDLDLVLIRSKFRGGNVVLPYEVARKVDAQVHQRTFESSFQVSQWDRVGIISLSDEFKDATGQGKFQSAKVTEALGDGVHTSTLQELCMDAEAVAIRHLTFPAEAAQVEAKKGSSKAAHPAEQKAKAAESEFAMEDSEEDSEDDDDDEENDEKKSMIGGKVRKMESSVVAIAERGECIAKWYQLLGKVIQKKADESALREKSRRLLRSNKGKDPPSKARQYWDGLLMEQAPWMSAMKDEFMSAGESNLHLDELKQMFSKYEEKEDAGLNYDQSLAFFAELEKHPKLGHRFSGAEVLHLMTGGNKTCSALRERDRMTKDAFIEQWLQSRRLACIARLRPKEIVSGFFVSYALQKMGFLSSDQEHYFYPERFASVKGEKGEILPGEVGSCLLGGVTMAEEVTVKGPQ